ncbi:Cytochrome b-c1 complex subunit 9 [Geodia barretti]|uniref:Complex III subunit 9 n=1 Tax=Geodia barretti TaxID=519541 RepID=A0AA35TA02_GEOBA|nr:Cytochrome b-c1 complex subunit 9 [Geodia barretti]
MAFGNAVYNALFRRTSTFALTAVLGGVVFERWYSSWSDSMWERINRGKLWKDIAHNYEEADE